MLREEELEVSSRLLEEHKMKKLCGPKIPGDVAFQLDVNTKFFHLPTIIGKRRNNNDAIKDERGPWLHDQ